MVRIKHLITHNKLVSLSCPAVYFDFKHEKFGRFRILPEIWDFSFENIKTDEIHPVVQSVAGVG